VDRIFRRLTLFFESFVIKLFFGEFMKNHSKIIVCAWLGLLTAFGGCKKESNRPLPAIAWSSDFETAQNTAASNRRILMMEFAASWCPSCRLMNDSTFTDSTVIEKTRFFVPVKIDVDERKDLAERFGGNARKYGGVGIPNILFLAPDGRRLAHVVGYLEPAALSVVMDSVLSIR
jgi:thiol:disulfide interchange protein